MTIADRVRELASEFAAEEDLAVRNRSLTDTTWRNLQETGLLRALRPARWGGGAAPLPEFLDAVFELARVAPSAGWVAGVVGARSWQSALFPEQAQRELWGEDAARVLAASHVPTGQVVPVAGGYRVSGRWAFAAGCDHAHGVIVSGEAGPAEADGGASSGPGSLILYRDQYRIEDTWHTAGLRGAGGKDIVVADAFVPEHRFLPHEAPAGDPGPSHRMPWATVRALAPAAAALGMMQGFVDEWTAITATRRANWGGFVREDPVTQKHLADAYWTLDAAVLKLRRAAELTAAGRPVEETEQARHRWDVTRGCELAGDAVADLYRVSSGRVAFLDHPLHGRFQNIVAALGHAFLAADAPALAYAARELGATPQEMTL